MMIIKSSCAELGLPEPKGYETQVSYIKRVISEGYEMNTRIARYIGIHNLHSVVSDLNKKGLLFNQTHEPRRCPRTGDIPPYKVDVISMSREQLDANQLGKEKPSKELTKEG